MKLRRFFFVLGVVAALDLTLAACELVGAKPTKMSAGELYESGDAKYDPYFKKVHEEQVAAANWPEESKTARKPLTTALDLPPNASTAAILSAAKEKKDKPNVKSAAEETAALEKAFAEKQTKNIERLEKLASEGVELRKQATEDRHNMGADKADPDKVEHKENIKREISAAADVAANLRDDAKKGVQDIQRLIEGLKKELGISGEMAAPAKKDDASPSASAAPKDDAKKPARDPQPAAKKPESKPATKKADTKAADDAKPAPAAKPAATQKPADEVFNP